MKIFSKLMLAILLVGLAGSGFAGNDKSDHYGKKVHINYVGFGLDTMLDSDDEFGPVNWIHANGWGTFGRSTMAISVEFVIDEAMAENCPADYPVHFAIVPTNNWAMIITTAANRQIFGLYNTGWMCMTPDYLRWFGETDGVFIGGTGRFKTASGEWHTRFEGVNLDAASGLRSISGDVMGTLHMD